MQTRTSPRVGIIAVALLTAAAAYPVFVLGYTWSHVAASNLAGGRHGPLDAYRHTLASAVVGFTLGARAVEGVTWVMERDGRDENLMDRHNNRIGAGIGARAHRFSDIEPAVRAQVLKGTINAGEPMQTTWLAPERWRTSRLW